MARASPRPHEITAGPTIELALRSATARLASASDTPRLDAEVLLMHTLGRTRSFLRAWPEFSLTGTQAEHFQELLEERAKGTPVAYLTAEREFWSRRFAVRAGVLIPRPETELLIELALRFLPAAKPVTILDLGTGSGILAVTLAAELPLARVTATDLSPTALATAQENAIRHGVKHIEFALGNWFTPVPEGRAFDLIVSNPPYIAEADPHLRCGDVRFEPALALTAGPDGLGALAAIAGEAHRRLQPGGRLLLEHGYDQADAVAALLARHSYADITGHCDLQGHPRAIAGLRP